MTYIWYNPGALVRHDRKEGRLETLGHRLEAARRRRILTQAELAQAAGVALITVTRLENEAGSGNPRPETIRRLAKALEVDPAWLLFGDQELESKIAA